MSKNYTALNLYSFFILFIKSFQYYNIKAEREQMKISLLVG